MLRRRVDKKRFGCHTERSLYRERCISQEPAGVAGARYIVSGRADDLERGLLRSREPGAELDRGPVVLIACEGDEHWPGRYDLARNEDADVAGRSREQGAQLGILDECRWGVDENQVDVLLCGDPDQVEAGCGGGERRNAGWA